MEQEKFFYPIEGTEPSESYILLLHNTTGIKNYFYLFSSLCLQIESEKFLFLKKNSGKYYYNVHVSVYLVPAIREGV